MSNETPTGVWLVASQVMDYEIRTNGPYPCLCRHTNPATGKRFWRRDCAALGHHSGS